MLTSYKMLWEDICSCVGLVYVQVMVLFSSFTVYQKSILSHCQVNFCMCLKKKKEFFFSHWRF